MKPPTRLDELVQGCLNGTLGEAEERELARLLQESHAARQALRAALRLEGGLLTLAKAGALGGDVPAPAAPAPPPRRLPLRRFLFGAVAAAAAVLVLVAGWRLLTPAPAVVPAAAAVARIVEAEGSVEVVSAAGETRAAAAGEALRAGEEVRTGEGNSVAVLELADTTRLELSPETAVRLPADGTRGVELIQGVVRGGDARHADRPPLVVTTTGLEVRLDGDRFVLSSASPESLRVDMLDGKAEVWRQRDRQSRVVESGDAVLIRADVDAMTVGAAPRVVSEPRRVLDFPGAWAVFFEPDGEHLLAASYRETQRFGAGPRPEQAPLSGDKHQGRLAAFSRDGNTLAVYRGLAKDDPVIVWDLATRRQTVKIDARITDQRLALAPDGSWLATVDRAEVPAAVRVWDVATGAERFRATSEYRVERPAASPDSRLLAVGIEHLGRRELNRLLLLDARTGQEVASLPSNAYPLTALAFSPDGRYLAAGITGQVQVWDVEKRERVRTIRGFERVVTTLAYSPDGRLLAAGTQDGQVWLWDAASGDEVQVIQAGTSGVRVLAFSPDGRTLLTGGIKKQPLMLWDVPRPPARI